MKCRDLIAKIVREDMPDVEKVREACHTQVHQKKIPRLRWAMTAFIATLLFVGSAYAVSVMLPQRVDPGGDIEFVLVAEDDPEYWERRDGRNHGQLIYKSPNAVLPYRFIFAPSVINVHFETEHRARINQMLEGAFFIEDGSVFPYEFLSPTFNTRGHTLYTATGNEVVYIRIWYENHFPARFEFLTIDQFNARYGYSATFEEAAAILGAEFRLPALPGYDGPMFSTNHGVAVVYVSPPDRWRTEAVFFRISNERAEGQEPFELTRPGVAERFYIEETAVYKISSMYYATLFTWAFDGLVYQLYPPTRLTDEYEREYIFSDEEMREIIASMLR